MGFKGLGVGLDGAAVEGSGIFEATLGVGDVAGIKEGAASVGWAASQGSSLA
jgi:hypothetical protein